MKYIKLYEAFKATILSKMNSYLKSNGVSGRSKTKFLEDLNKIFSSFGVPIDKMNYIQLKVKKLIMNLVFMDSNFGFHMKVTT